MPYHVDASAVHAERRQAERWFRLMPGRMLRLLAFAAQFERDTHPYTNRTGRLEHTTRGYVAVATDTDTVGCLEMFMPYASFVRCRGYSHIDEAAALVARELGRGLVVSPLE